MTQKRDEIEMVSYKFFLLNRITQFNFMPSISADNLSSTQFIQPDLELREWSDQQKIRHAAGHGNNRHNSE